MIEFITESDIFIKILGLFLFALCLFNGVCYILWQTYNEKGDEAKAKRYFKPAMLTGITITWGGVLIGLVMAFHIHL